MSKRESAINKYRRHHFGDWAVMTGRRACTFADQGVLLKAIDLYWRFGCEGLPAKTNELAELLDCDPEEAQSMLDHTVGHFTDGDSIHWTPLEISTELRVILPSIARTTERRVGVRQGEAIAYQTLTNR